MVLGAPEASRMEISHPQTVQGALVNTSMLCEARTRLVTFQPLPTVTAQLFPREQTLLLFRPFADICFFFKKKKKKKERKNEKKS